MEPLNQAVALTQDAAFMGSVTPLLVGIGILLIGVIAVFSFKRKPKPKQKTVLFSTEPNLIKTRNDNDSQTTAGPDPAATQPSTLTVSPATSSNTLIQDEQPISDGRTTAFAAPTSVRISGAEIDDDVEPFLPPKWPTPNLLPQTTTDSEDDAQADLDITPIITTTPVEKPSFNTKSTAFDIAPTTATPTQETPADQHQAPDQTSSREIIEFTFDDDDLTDESHVEPPILDVRPTTLATQVTSDDRLPNNSPLPQYTTTSQSQSPVSATDETQPHAITRISGTLTDDDESDTAPIIDAEARRRAEEQVQRYLLNGPTKEEQDALEKERLAEEERLANEQPPQELDEPDTSTPGAIVRAVQWTKQYYGDVDSLAVDKPKRLEIIEMLKNLEDPDFALPILDLAMREEQDEPEIVTAVYAAMVESYNTEILAAMHTYFHKHGTPEQRIIAKRGLIGLGYRSQIDDADEPAEAAV